MVLVAGGAGYGLAALCDVPFTSLQQILPFILIAIGIDDAYVITNALDNIETSLPIVERVRLAYARAGMSITLTSLTDIFAFLLGATSPLPAVSFFCIYAAFGIVLIYVFYVSWYPAMLVLDERRRAAGRADVLCCFTCAGPVPNGDAELGAGGSPLDPEDTYSRRLMRGYASVLIRPTSKALVVLVFVAMTGVLLYTALAKTTTGFDIVDLTPDSSYMRDFFDVEVVRG
jgi:Niemann-Pick C1 protein